jgi:regulator of RNase E activity RraB
MADVPTITKNVPRLEKPSDWTPWLRSIRLTAESHGIWLYAKPDGTETLPDYPIQLESPDPSSIDAVYRLMVSDHHEKKKQMRLLSSRIIETISTGYQARIPEGTDTARGRLVLLKTSVAMTDNLREILIEERHDRLMKGVQGKNVTKWLNDWVELLAEADTITDTVFSEKRLCMDFVRASRRSNPEFANAIAAQLIISPKDGLTMTKMVSDYAIIASTMRTAKDSGSTGAYATLNGLTPMQLNAQAAESASTALPATSVSKPVPECLCGNRHYFSDCPYLNTAKRP